MVSAPGFEAHGWTLNVSRGGIRAVVDNALSAEIEYELRTDGASEARRVRLVWAKEEADGQIVGLRFLDAPDSAPAPETGPE